MAKWRSLLACTVVTLVLNGCDKPQPSHAQVQVQSQSQNTSLRVRTSLESTQIQSTKALTPQHDTVVDEAAADCSQSTTESGFQLSFGHGWIHGRGDMVSDRRAITAFRRMAVGSAIRATVLQGNSFVVTLLAQENVLPHVITDIVNGSLRLAVDNSICGVDQPIEARVVAPSIDEILAEEGSRVEFNGGGLSFVELKDGSFFSANNLAAGLSGALNLKASGMSHVNIKSLQLTQNSETRFTAASGSDVTLGQASGLGQLLLDAADQSKVAVTSGHCSLKVTASNGASVDLTGLSAVNATLAAEGMARIEGLEASDLAVNVDSMASISASAAHASVPHCEGMSTVSIAAPSDASVTHGDFDSFDCTLSVQALPLVLVASGGLPNWILPAISLVSMLATFVVAAWIRLSKSAEIQQEMSKSLL